MKVEGTPTFPPQPLPEGSVWSSFVINGKSIANLTGITGPIKIIAPFGGLVVFLPTTGGAASAVIKSVPLEVQLARIDADATVLTLIDYKTVPLGRTFEATQDQTYFAIGSNYRHINERYWGATNTNLLTSKPMIDGYQELKPDDLITRAEFVTMAMEVLSDDLNPKSDKTFSDVSPTDWYHNAVTKGFENSILTGDHAGNFNGGANITKEEMIAIVVRILESKNGPLTERR